MATLKDVAQKAGVNISTASRALNGSPSISPKTTLLVKQIAKELNYIPNANARILAGKSSKMVGIIVPETNSDYFSKMIETLEMKLQENGYFLIIANTQFDPQKEAAVLDNFMNYNIDGIFLVCSVDIKELTKYHRMLSAREIPLVALDTRLAGADCNQIMVDDVVGLTIAIQHLLERGHKKIGYLADYVIDGQLRTDMFRQALYNNGLTPADHPIISHPTCRFEQAGYEVMKQFLALPSYPSAYLAGYDDMAIGAMRAIEEAGLRIPEDIAIIGNDNGRAGNYLHLRLTTLSPPVEKMAKVGVNMMLDFIQKEEEKDMIHHISLLPELLIRETT